MIKNNLSAILGAKRISQREVSRATGLAISTVNQLYNEEVKRIDLDTLDKLCTYLGVQVGDIFVHQPGQEGKTK